MINTSHPKPIPSKELLAYLKQKIGLSTSSLKLGIRQSELEQAPLPIVLWSFGLINLEQYQQILDWQNDQL